MKSCLVVHRGGLLWGEEARDGLPYSSVSQTGEPSRHVIGRIAHLAFERASAFINGPTCLDFDTAAEVRGSGAILSRSGVLAASTAQRTKLDLYRVRAFLFLDRTGVRLLVRL